MLCSNLNDLICQVSRCVDLVEHGLEKFERVIEIETLAPAVQAHGSGMQRNLGVAGRFLGPEIHRVGGRQGPVSIQDRWLRL